MEKLSKLLSDFRINKGFTQKEAAEALGISLRMYTGYEKGDFEPKGVRLEKYLRKLADFNMLASEPEVLYDKTTLKKKVPVFDIQAQASPVGSFDDDLKELPKSYITIPGFEDCTFAVYVWGHSMYPTYDNGCMVIVKEVKEKSFIQYGSAYLVITNEQRIVKRMYEDETDNRFVLLASDNPEQRKDQKVKYPTYRLEKEAINRLFLVKGTIKRTEI